jgi:alpha-glucoside transport system permease protein
MLLLTVYLVYPTVSTFITSFTSNLTNGDPLTHYKALLSDEYLKIFTNNIIWLVVGTAGSVGLGLLIAGLVDRVHREALAKTFIFLPLAISLIGASVIWRFVYAWQPEGQTQYGLLNAIWTGLGFDPVPWVTTQPINTYLLILIFVWIWAGFAMVVLSAAIKGVSVEVIEAARLDGASERRIFFGVIVPIIRGSIITVATTIAIAVLKIFDIVFVMTGGRSGTDVVANNMYLQMFQFFNDGRAAALAVVLFIAVSPIIFVNVRNLNRQGIGA